MDRRYLELQGKGWWPGGWRSGAVGLNGTRISAQEDQEFWRWMMVGASGHGEGT